MTGWSGAPFVAAATPAAARVVDLRRTPPPVAWGVRVDLDALDAVAARLAAADLPAPGHGLVTLPHGDPPGRWCDFVGASISVMACLWPPEGAAQWTTEHDGVVHTDAPALFAAFRRVLTPRRDGRDGYDLSVFADWSLDDTTRLFAGRGVLQLLPERHAVLRDLARTMLDRYDGSFVALVEACGYDAESVVRTLVDEVPGYHDVAVTPAGVLRFEKLPRLATAMMAAGLDRPLAGLDDFPVYPDYMIPKVLRHWGAFVYDPALASAVDARRLVPAGSDWEHALRWATVWAGDELRRRLHAHGRSITGPQLDFALWHAGVLGPDAAHMGEHHRTLTMHY